MARGYLTHKEVETLCDMSLLSQNWERHELVLGKGFKPEEEPLPGIPDRVYQKEGQVLFLEIKPGNCTNGELRRGLGQIMSYYPYDVKAYLVLSQEQWNRFKATIKFFSWLGVLIYDSETYRVKVAQRVKKSPQGLSPFPVSLKLSERPYRYRSTEIAKFIGESRSIEKEL